MARQIDPVWTKATRLEALGTLSASFQHVFGRLPTFYELTILAAHSALETGHWQKMRNWNVGGIKASVYGVYDWANYGTKEVANGRDVSLEDNFRAYPNLRAGFENWLELLRGRYPKALATLDRLDPEGFVRQLKAGRYFTANEGAYARSVASLATTFARWLRTEHDAGRIRLQAFCQPETYGDQLLTRVLGDDESEGL